MSWQNYPMPVKRPWQEAKTGLVFWLPELTAAETREQIKNQKLRQRVGLNPSKRYKFSPNGHLRVYN